MSMEDKLSNLLTGLRNAILNTISDILNVLKTQGIYVEDLKNDEIAGDWAWDIITKALENGIINLSDADYDAIYHVFRRCATLEEMIRDAMDRVSEIDEQFVNELMDDFRENAEALSKIKEHILILLNR